MYRPFPITFKTSFHSGGHQRFTERTSVSTEYLIDKNSRRLRALIRKKHFFTNFMVRLNALWCPTVLEFFPVSLCFSALVPDWLFRAKLIGDIQNEIRSCML